MGFIKGKIAAIISATTIVINKGSKDGVKENMEFVVRLNLPDIVDPDDESNILTGVFFEKGRITVSKVFENMSFASLKGKVDSLPNFSSQGFFKVLYPEVDANLTIPKSDWKIKVGDEVTESIKEKK